MKSILSLTVCLVLFSAMDVLQAADPVPMLSTGSPMIATDIPMMGVDGESWTIDKVKGEKGTLVIFSCNTCPWVVAWEKRIAGITSEYLKKGIGSIIINPNDPAKSPGDGMEEMKKRAAEINLKVPYVVDVDSKVAKAYKATRTPEFFLFNSQGKLAYMGTIDDNAEDAEAVKHHFLRDALDQTLKGEMVTVSKTKSFGCTIKFYE